MKEKESIANMASNRILSIQTSVLPLSNREVLIKLGIKSVLGTILGGEDTTWGGTYGFGAPLCLLK